MVLKNHGPCGTAYRCVSKPIIIKVNGVNTTINPSYFDVNKRATFGFDPKPYMYVYVYNCVYIHICIYSYILRMS